MPLKDVSIREIVSEFKENQGIIIMAGSSKQMVQLCRI